MTDKFDEWEVAGDLIGLKLPDVTKCKHCGTKFVFNKANYCPQCGMELNSDAPTTIIDNPVRNIDDLVEHLRLTSVKYTCRKVDSIHYIYYQGMPFMQILDDYSKYYRITFNKDMLSLEKTAKVVEDVVPLLKQLIVNNGGKLEHE